MAKLIQNISTEKLTSGGAFAIAVRLHKSIRILSARKKDDNRIFPAGFYVLTGGCDEGLRDSLHEIIVNGQGLPSFLRHGRIADVQTGVGDGENGKLIAEMVEQWPSATQVTIADTDTSNLITGIFRFDRRPGQSIHAHTMLAHLDDAYCELRKIYRNHALDNRDPFQTLIGCILSLRTQDPVTHAAMARLFARCPTPTKLLAVSDEEIARIIYPVGMYRQKAKRLLEIARIVRDDWGNRVSAEIDELVTLPGVGRKTANLVRSFAFHLPAICVDTHVHRITNRWGLVRTVTPDETEFELRRLLPQEYWVETNALLIQLGQNICRPIRPNCSKCPISAQCQYPRIIAENDIIAAIPSAPPHPVLKRIGPKIA